MTTDLGSLGDLRTELGQARATVTALWEVVGVLPDWSAGLPERLAAARFGTARLGGSAAMVAEAGTSVDLPAWCEAVMEALAVVESAVAEAERLGEHAGEIAATGHVEAYTPD